MSNAVTLHVVIGHLRRILPLDNFRVIEDCALPFKVCHVCGYERFNCIKCTLEEYQEQDWEPREYMLCPECREVSWDYFQDSFIYSVRGEIRMKKFQLRSEKKRKEDKEE